MSIGLFTLFQIKIGDFSIDRFLSVISSNIMNILIETTKYNEIPIVKPDAKTYNVSNPLEKVIPNSDENINKLPLKNIKECYPRFEIFYLILKMILFGLIGFGFMSLTFPNQVKKAQC